MPKKKNKANKKGVKRNNIDGGNKKKEEDDSSWHDEEALKAEKEAYAREQAAARHATANAVGGAGAKVEEVMADTRTEAEMTDLRLACQDDQLRTV